MLPAFIIPESFLQLVRYPALLGQVVWPRRWPVMGASSQGRNGRKIQKPLGLVTTQPQGGKPAPLGQVSGRS